MQKLVMETKPTPKAAAFSRCPICRGMCNIFEGEIHCRRVDTCGWKENKENNKND